MKSARPSVLVLTGLISVTAMMVAAACASSGGDRTIAPTSPSPTTVTSSVPEPTTTTSAPPPAPGVVVGTPDFVDANHGFAPLARRCGTPPCSFDIFATVDGGRTWEPRSRQPIVLGDSTETPQPLIHFATPDVGWIYLVRFPGAADTGGRLWRTTDGGRTWGETPTPGGTVNLVAHGHQAWRVEQHCPPDPKSRCDVTVLTTADSGAHWSALRVQPPTVGQFEGFAAPTATVAYLLSNEDQTGADHPRAPVLARTADAGRTWISVRPPCTGFRGEDFTVSTAFDLWFVCLDEPGSGAMQSKHLYRSHDGGRSWSADLGTPNAGAGGETVAGSPSRACRAGTRTRVACTRDGGRHWFFPIPGGADNPRDGGVTMIEFADADHAWALAQDVDTGNYDVLWRTADGGETWIPSAIDPDGPRLFLVPDQGPVGTTITVVGQHCTPPSARQAQLVFETTATQRPEGADDLPAAPADLQGGFSLRYRIPTQLHSLKGQGGGPTAPGLYEMITKPPACQRGFRLTTL